jgi:hypothetical protein
MKALGILTGVLLAACNPTVEAKNYSQTCSQASECVAVTLGALCQVCGCANGAINVSDKARYDVDVKTLSGGCPPRVGPQPLCAPCPQPIADCVSGQCVLKSGQ